MLVVILAAGGGFYLWFRSQVGAANARTDPAIIQALGEKASETTTTTSLPATPTSQPGPISSSTSSSTSSTTSTTSPASPSGMNIVILGSDRRESEGSSLGRSDTIILMHVDPKKNFLSILSVPRDLRVEVPGHGLQKINAAYAYGGAALVIRTIQKELGVDLDHYIEVDFSAFEEITDKLGGVYVDVDRTYDDGKIQLSPGYQLLDGLNALRFVRTRHDTNIDFGRMERQQRFLSALREQAMGWNLPLKLPSLIKALFGNVDTDLSANQILSLAYWGIKLDGSRMKQASIIADTGTIDDISYVLASDKEIATAVNDFLAEPVKVSQVAQDAALGVGDPNAVLSTADLSDTYVDVLNGSGRSGQAALAAAWLSRQGAHILDLRTTGRSPQAATEVTYPSGRAASAKLVGQALGIPTTRQDPAVERVTVSLGKGYFISASLFPAGAAAEGLSTAQAQSLAAKAGFSLSVPSYAPASCRYSSFRTYSIKVGKGSKPAVRIIYQFKGQDQYLGFSATTWLDAPLASAGDQIKDGGLTYTVVGTTSKPDYVWWAKDGVLYWVSNTLQCELTKEELLAVAMTAVEIP